MTGNQENEVLCGANSYEEKYYFNDKFKLLPIDIRQELQAMCVLYTEECGGVLTVEFTPSGSLVLKTRIDDNDYFYDEIESGLEIRKLQQEKAELFEALELFYRTLFLRKTE